MQFEATHHEHSGVRCVFQPPSRGPLCEEMKMTTRCPHCGWLLSKQISDEDGQLAATLATPVLCRPARAKNRAFDTRREVYQSARGKHEWFVTYGREVGFAGPYGLAAVTRLLERGLLEPSYPDTEAATYCYRLKAA